MIQNDCQLVDAHSAGPARARRFVAEYTPGVSHDRIGGPGEPSRDALERTCQERHIPLPADIWVEARINGQLVGVGHASAHTAMATELLTRVGMASPTDSKPAWATTSWLRSYLRECLNVEEIAVLPEYRGMGIGSAILARIELRAAQDDDRTLRFLNAYVSDDAVATFSRNGFTIGRPGETVPPEFACGLPSQWDPAADTQTGFYAWKAHT